MNENKVPSKVWWVAGAAAALGVSTVVISYGSARAERTKTTKDDDFWKAVRRGRNQVLQFVGLGHLVDDEKETKDES